MAKPAPIEELELETFTYLTFEEHPIDPRVLRTLSVGVEGVTRLTATDFGVIVRGASSPVLVPWSSVVVAELVE